VHRHGDGHRRPPGAELLEHLQVDLVGLPSPTELLRVGQPEQAEPAEGREQPLGIGLGPLVLVHAGRQLLVRDLADEREQVLRLLAGQQAVDGHSGPLPGRFSS
jgi:hypothetical protein